MGTRILFLGLVLLSACLSVAGCTTVNVWERGYLSKAEMSWQPDSLQAAMEDHIYFSKEASNGNTNAGGGGCGCN